MRFTDDTQMFMDIANLFLANAYIDQAHLAKTFAEHYRWSRGYGPGSANILVKPRKGANWSELN